MRDIARTSSTGITIDRCSSAWIALPPTPREWLTDRSDDRGVAAHVGEEGELGEEGQVDTAD